MSRMALFFKARSGYEFRVATLLMISRNRVVPAFLANQFAVLGEMPLGIIIEIMQVAAEIDDDAPDQSAAEQLNRGRTFGVNGAFFRMIITENVGHLLVILHAAPGILACVIPNPGNTGYASEQIVCFGPDLRRPGVAFGFHTFKRRCFFRREKMWPCRWFQRDEGKLQL